MSKLAKNFVAFLSSSGLCVVLVLLMLLLTFLGTIEQGEHGLYQVQQKYFESLFLIHELHVLNVDIPVPLPGGYLVMSLFALNLLAGGVVRGRKDWRTPGVLIAHLGILVMLGGAYVSFKYSYYGSMSLYEGESSDEFISFQDWAVEIQEPGGSGRVLVLPQEHLEDLEGDKSRTFTFASLPFDVKMSGYVKNGTPVAARTGQPPPFPVVDGFFLQTLSDDPEISRNVPGVYVSVVDKATGATTDGVLWGLSDKPFTVVSDGTEWTFDLTRKRWHLDFTITLDKFIHEYHPGTGMASNYESEVTKTEAGAQESIRIYMNHPLRHRGYTFFQESWGQRANSAPGEGLYTRLRVVKNPADSMPLISCIIISFGLTLHFVQMLVRYLRAESMRRSA